MNTIEERGQGYVTITPSAGPSNDQSLHATLNRSQGSAEDLGFDVPGPRAEDSAAGAPAARNDAPAFAMPPIDGAQSEPLQAPGSPTQTVSGSEKSIEKDLEALKDLPDGMADLLELLKKAQEEEAAAPGLSTALAAAKAKVARITRKMFFVQQAHPDAKRDQASECCGSIWDAVCKRRDVRDGSAEVWVPKSAYEFQLERFDRLGLIAGTNQQRIQECNAMAAECRDADELATIAKKIAELKAITPAMQLAAARILFGYYSAIAEPYERLLGVVDGALQKMLDDAVNAEKQFFARHGLPWVETEVSARVLRAQRQAAQYRTQLDTLRGQGVRGNPSAPRMWTPPPFVVAPE